MRQATDIQQSKCDFWGSSNGRTPDSDSENSGSNPFPQATIRGSSNGRISTFEAEDAGSTPAPRAKMMQEWPCK